MSDRGSCFGGFLKGTRGGGLSWSAVPPAEPEFQSFRGSCDLQSNTWSFVGSPKCCPGWLLGGTSSSRRELGGYLA